MLNTTETNDETTILEKNIENQTEENQDPNESLRKLSDVTLITTPRKVSDIVNRKLSDSDAHSHTLTFRDVMLSMIQPSSESGSDVESNSDEEEFMIVPNTSAEPVPACCGEENEVIEEENTESDDTPPQRPPRRSKANSRRRAFEDSLDLESNLSCSQEYPVTIATSDEQKDVSTAEVDGVDIIDTHDNTQGVSCIDQGEDMVILDLKDEAKETISDSSTEQSPERTNAEVTSDNDDDNFMGANTVSDATASPHKAAEMSFDEFSMRLSQIAETHPNPPDDSGIDEQTASLNEEAEDAEEDDDVEVTCKPHGGGAVSLTRVKCMVSMTTPRDARAHGATDCPPFVEFDMSVDGFGCLFLPAIAPQVSAGKLHLDLRYHLHRCGSKN